MSEDRRRPDREMESAHRHGRQTTEVLGEQLPAPETPLGESVKARIPNQHKGDVKDGANDAVYQGSKTREIS